MQVFLAENLPPMKAAEMARISETGKRVIDYYRERLTLEEIIRHMDDLLRGKELQLQVMARLIHSEKCIREEVLAYFGEEEMVKPEFCCSICGPIYHLQVDWKHQSSGKRVWWIGRKDSPICWDNSSFVRMCD